MKTMSILIAGTVFAAAAQAAGAAPPPGSKPLDTHLPASSVPPAAHTAPVTRDARGEAPPHVTVRRKDDKVIEAYSRNGQVYMVRVTPKNGIPYSYKVSGNGALEPQNGAPPVSPAMYTVLKWGAPKHKSDDDNGGG